MKISDRRYVKVRLGPGRFVVVGEPREVGGELAGWRASMDGERWERETATATQSGLVVFRAEDVVAELRLNLHYGKLETVGR